MVDLAHHWGLGVPLGVLEGDHQLDPSAAATRSSVSRVGLTRPASSRAIAGWVEPMRRPSSAWLIPRASRSPRIRSPNSSARQAR
jgi:hypothetical protein